MSVLSELAKIPIGSYATWGAVILVAATGLVQIAPIKINPWSAAASAIGRAINKDVIAKVEKLEDEITEMRRVGEKRRNEEDERNAKEARRRILRFGDEVRHGQRHSKEHCDEIILDITDYEHYCATHPDFKNQKAQSTIKLLVKEYERCLAENDFLE